MATEDQDVNGGETNWGSYRRLVLNELRVLHDGLADLQDKITSGQVQDQDIANRIRVLRTELEQEIERLKTDFEAHVEASENWLDQHNKERRIASAKATEGKWRTIAAVSVAIITLIGTIIVAILSHT